MGQQVSGLAIELAADHLQLHQLGEGSYGSAGTLVVFLRFKMAAIPAYKQLPGSGSFLDD